MIVSKVRICKSAWLHAWVHCFDEFSTKVRNNGTCKKAGLSYISKAWNGFCVFIQGTAYINGTMHAKDTHISITKSMFNRSILCASRKYKYKAIYCMVHYTVQYWVAKCVYNSTWSGHSCQFHMADLTEWRQA